MCTIAFDHRMHSGQRISRSEDPTICIFACEECAVKDNSVYVRCMREESAHGESVSSIYWNYLTGERVTAGEIGRGVTKKERLRKNRKAFLI